MERLDCDACQGTGRDDPLARHESLTIKPPSCMVCNGRGWVPRVEWTTFPLVGMARVGRVDVVAGGVCPACQARRTRRGLSAGGWYSVSLFGVEQAGRRDIDLPLHLIRAMAVNEAVRVDTEYGELWPDD